MTWSNGSDRNLDPYNWSNTNNNAGNGGDNYAFDGSGASGNNAWVHENPFSNPGMRPNDRTNCRPAYTTESPDGKTINVFYINNAYFNGQGLPQDGVDYRRDPQYNFQQFDPNYQQLAQQQQLRNFYQQQAAMNRAMQYQDWQGQNQNWSNPNQNWGVPSYNRCYGNNGWNNGGWNTGYNTWGGGPGGVFLSFNFGGGHHGGGHHWRG